MFSWQLLLKDKRQLVKWLFVILVPTLLVAGFIGATSHMAQHASKLQVAVVNQDQSAKYQGKTQNVGKNFAEVLQKSKTLSFVTYSTPEKANDALHTGRVSGVVILPKSLTQDVSEFKKTGKSVTIKQIIASGQSQFASQYVQHELDNVLNRENARLMMGVSNDSVLKNLTTQSQNLSQESSDLQLNLQAIGNGIDTDNAEELQEKATDVANKMANYSAQMNDAVQANDTAKIQEMAVAMNDLSYTMQTSVVGGIGNIAASLNTTKALSDKSGIIQSSAKTLKKGQTSIADKLQKMSGEQADNKETSPLTQLLVFDRQDVQPIRQSGQTILPNILVIGVTLLAILFGLLLPMKPVKQEALALEQWWENFQVAGLLNAIAVALMVASGIFWHVSLFNFWVIVGITIVASWAMMSIIWYLKEWLGQLGWWLGTTILTLQTIFAVTTVPQSMTTGIFNYFYNIWPLSALNHVVRQLIFGGNIQQNVIILVIWFLAITILLVTYYRMKQRQNFKAMMADEA